MTTRSGLVARLVDALRGRLSAARRGGRSTFERDDSVGYFRDLSGRAPGPGVQEEDDVPRWGRGEQR